MKNKTFITAIQKYALLFCALASPLSLAYDPRTHQEISELSLNRSQLFEGGALWRLGIAVDPIGNPQHEWVEHADAGTDARFQTITELVRTGAKEEDDGTRGRNHFYDPIYDRPATIGAAELGSKSNEWALEFAGEERQSWSLRDMKGFFYQALVSRNERESDKEWTKAFLALGHVIHHVQDMAQPQHARNDVHCDDPRCAAFRFPYEPSFYEWLSAHMGAGGFVGRVETL